MKTVKKYWWVGLLLAAVVAYFAFLKPKGPKAMPAPSPSTGGENAGSEPPAGLINPTRWMQLYNQKIESIKKGEPFSDVELANREKYKWTPRQHMHNKAVWYANRKGNANVNANEWNWPKN